MTVEKSSVELVLCTLFEGGYHFGVAALTNSLISSGFSGRLVAGHRGPVPEWAVKHPGFDPTSSVVRAHERVSLEFRTVETPLHLTLYKPTWILQLHQELTPAASTIAYVDPDIVVKCPWRLISDWIDAEHISLIEDVNGYVPARHPMRRQWSRAFGAQGFVEVRELERYYNAGFVAVPSRHLDVVRTWKRACDVVAEHTQGSLKSGDSTTLFHSMDQDALNFTLTTHDVPLNTAGPEGMDFGPGGFLLSHAVGSPKPWQGAHVSRALSGFPPTTQVKAYYTHANTYLRPYSAWRLRARTGALAVSAAIGRFYSRR